MTITKYFCTILRTTLAHCMMSIKHNCVFNLLDCAVIRIKKMRGMDSDND